MRIVAIRARTHRWPIDGEGAARGRSERASVLLEVRTDRNAFGLGEAAPLPGMSIDSLDDAERALAAFARRAPFDVLARDTRTSDEHIGDQRLSRDKHICDRRTSRDEHIGDQRLSRDEHIGDQRISQDAPHDPRSAPPRADAIDPYLAFDVTDRGAAHAFASSPPSARFAIETALLDALGREARASIATLLSPLVDHVHARDEASFPPGRAPHVGAHSSSSGHAFPHVRANHRAVPLAAVVDDPQAACAAFATGIRCLKIKLVASDDPDRVMAIAAAVPEARLRIDANRTWPQSEVIGRLAALAHLPIDYVEEPCREAHRLLAQPLPCRLALDESLLEMTAAEIQAAVRSPMLAALVLKPTLLGGVSVVLSLAALARRAGIAAVVSHTLEGPIGTAACAELALALGGEHPVGLAPHAALAGWSIEAPQLAADQVRASPAPGLGFADLALAGVVHV